MGERRTSCMGKALADRLLADGVESRGCSDLFATLYGVKKKPLVASVRRIPQTFSEKQQELHRGRRAGPFAPGRRAPSCAVPIDRVFSASAQPVPTCLGSRCLTNRLAPCGQDDSVARNHLARLRRERYWRLPPFDPASSMPSLLSRRSSSPIRSGQSRMRPTSSTRRATATRLASFGKLVVGALAHCRLVPILPCPHFSRG